MSNTTSNPNNLKKKSKRLPYLIAFFLGPILLAALAYYLLHINPLPKDEELIAHFRAHRGEIEELIRRYREFEPPGPGLIGHHLWKEQGDTPKLYKQAGLLYLDYIGSVWLPDPYSAETARRRDALFKQYGYKLHIKHAAIGIRLADQRYDTVSLLYMNHVWKDLWFIPEVPRVENGRLIEPMDTQGRLGKGSRVLLSLNDYPLDWGSAECVFRQIEPQWFINMCRV